MQVGLSIRRCSAALRGRDATPAGPHRAADQRNLGDSEGQRGTANLEVIGRLAAHLGRETAGARFHTAQASRGQVSALSAVSPVAHIVSDQERHPRHAGCPAGERGRQRMVEFSVRIDFYRDLEGPKDYVGSALRDGLSAVVLPRVGEHILGLGPDAWHKGPYGDPYSVVHAVEHRATPAWKLDPTKPEEEDPTVTLVFQALWPGDGPLAGPRMLREYDAQGGWQLHFFSDHAPVEPFPGHPLMGGLGPEGERRPEQPASDRDPGGGHVPRRLSGCPHPHQPAPQEHPGGHGNARRSPGRPPKPSHPHDPRRGADRHSRPARGPAVRASHPCGDIVRRPCRPHCGDGASWPSLSWGWR
jgi:hypothetical protein